MKTRGFLVRKTSNPRTVLPLSRRRLGSSANAGSGDRRGAARCWVLGPFLLLCSQAWRRRLRVTSACSGSRPCHATGLGQSHLVVASGLPCRGR